MSASRPESASAPPPPADANPAADDQNLESSRVLIFQYIPSWLTSFILHVVVIILLAIIPILVPPKEIVNLVAGDAAPALDTPTEINLEPLEDFSDALDFEPSEVTEPTLDTLVEAPNLTELPEALSMTDILNTADLGVEVSGDLAGAPVTGESDLTGRSLQNKTARGNLGASAATEQSVALGLQWLRDHQQEDGSWNFNHQLGPGKRTSPNPGQLEDCKIAATAMCLLAFLGNGQTHMEGDYQAEVEKALSWLVVHQVPVNKTAGKLMDPHYLGGIYAHGLASIALAEAYAMTKDTRLYSPAQAAINYLGVHQDPQTGGWRYQIRQPGDLSVTGWQLMALKSASMGDLEVAPKMTKGAIRFLDNVSVFSGARYTYQIGTNSPTPSMTAVGLLCRIYTGWKREHPALQRGMAYLNNIGPSLGENPNMYYNYYATQTMRQFGGEYWQAWDQKMREYLVRSQSVDGPTKGSWYFNPGSDDGIRAGGRIYCTALAIMTLEVYYRFLPIYRDEAAEDEFPLD